MSTTPPEASLYDRFQTFVLGTLGFAAFGLILVVLLFFRGCFAGDDSAKMDAEAAARDAKLEVVRTEQAAELKKLGLTGGDQAAVIGTALDAVSARPKASKSGVLVPGSETALAQLQSAPAEEADASSEKAESEEKTDK